MARREYYASPQCAHPGCKERGHYVFERRADEAAERARWRKSGGWLCTRHTKPDEVLMPHNPMREHVLVATELFSKLSRRDDEEVSLGLFWVPEGKESGSGFTFGPGFKAYAKDFPAGTRLVITAKIEPPLLGQSDD